jgi:hypothetical protein
MDVCQVCHQDEQWHMDHKPRHFFVREGEAPRLGEVIPPTAHPSTRIGDPVLRLALIKAGVLAEGDLSEADVWLRESANQGMAVIVEDGTYKLVAIEEWIAREAGKNAG